MSAASGYGARILRVDLSREQVTKEYLSEDVCRLYLGGVGLGARFLYNELPSGVDWNDPEKRLILVMWLTAQAVLVSFIAGVKRQLLRG